MNFTARIKENAPCAVRSARSRPKYVVNVEIDIPSKGKPSQANYSQEALPNLSPLYLRKKAVQTSTNKKRTHALSFNKMIN